MLWQDFEVVLGRMRPVRSHLHCDWQHTAQTNKARLTLQVGEMWAKASDEEKAAYIAMSNQDKQRYSAEMEAYNYRSLAASHTILPHTRFCHVLL